MVSSHPVIGVLSQNHWILVLAKYCNFESRQFQVDIISAKFSNWGSLHSPQSELRPQTSQASLLAPDLTKTKLTIIFYIV